MAPLLITFAFQKQIAMKHKLLLLMASCLVLACTSSTGGDRQYELQGAWTLRQMDYPIGRVRTFAEGETTLLRLYDGDSMMCQCWLTRTATGLIVKPVEQCRVRLIDKGHGEHVYLEDDDPRPLTVQDDSTIIIQQNGILHTWRSAKDIAEEWGAEIRELTAADMLSDEAGERQSYVLSAKERRQASVIHWFVFSTIGIVMLLLLIARTAIDYRKDRRRLQLQLQQIQEVRDERPQVVKQAIASVETDYFASDYYLSLQRRIATGQLLKDGEWCDIESQIKRVYPGFSSQLRGLHAMSELEYRVCLLVKLRVAPTDMAAVLARDVSTISTVRSRLYKKVFGQKGGAREWDDFILSIA